jgi:hypothetical protein
VETGKDAQAIVARMRFRFSGTGAFTKSCPSSAPPRVKYSMESVRGHQNWTPVRGPERVDSHNIALTTVRCSDHHLGMTFRYQRNLAARQR